MHIASLLLLTLLAVAGCRSESGSPGIAAAAAAEKAPSTSGDPLPSWNAGAPKEAVLGFVTRVTRPGSAEFVPQDQRIAVFDNDGTLWVEHPIPVQLVFTFDRVKGLAPRHPEWRDKQPFKAALEADAKALMASGEPGLMKLLGATGADITTAEFERTVAGWIESARHPRFKRRYTELVYQPMLEVLEHLRANGFKTFIVSGGGVEFMRPWAQRVYGVVPEQVVGSRGKLKYEHMDGKPVLWRLPEVDLIDDKAGKPVGIEQVIGRRPIVAFGNSDGDFEMLEWTTSVRGPRLGMIVHHTDAVREYAYDRDTHVGRLVRALDEAPKRGWVMIDMKQDWRVVFPHQKQEKKP